MRGLRISLFGLFGLIVLSAGLLALNPVAKPGTNFDLGAWKLQTVAEVGGQFLEVTPAELVRGWTSKFFYTDSQDGSLVMAVPSNAATTKNTHYARTELRQVGQGANWLVDDPARHVLKARLTVQTVAAAKPQTIIGQIHGDDAKDAELLKLRWTGNQPGKCFVEARFQKNDATKAEYGVELAKDCPWASLSITPLSCKAARLR